MTKAFSIMIAIYVLFIRDIYAQKNSTSNAETVKIGLLISNDWSIAAQNGAEMAIREANKKIGVIGRPFQLVTRSMEGSWGTGSKEAVSLVFKEKVWAIMGSHDGRNAHLVEQVIAKTHVVFLSAWASDPTLSQGFVPWYFSCVPNGNQQADALIEEILNKRKITKLAAVSDKGYDSRSALKSFVKKSIIEDSTEVHQFFYDNSNENFNKLLDQIANANVSCVVLFGQPAASVKIIWQMRQKKLDQPVFGALSLLGEDEFEEIELKHLNNVTLVKFSNRLREKELSFQNKYNKKYGKMPSVVAAYAFDGMNLIIEAIRQSGFDYEKIQESMSKTHYDGVTGTIQFDEKGNRINAAELIEIKNGIQVIVEK